MTWILIVGTFENGFDFIGTFNTREDAVKFAEDRFKPGIYWRPILMENPKEY